MQELVGVTSVLIPLYNHERFIGETLDSLLASDCSKIELIISDDASSDRSVQVASDWLARHGSKFRRTSLFAGKSNRGITASLNTMIEAATGEFITLLASDDMLPGDAVDMQRDYLLAHTDVDFLFVNCTIIDMEGRPIKQRAAGPFISGLLSLRLFALLNMLFNWSVIWSRLFGRRRKFLKFGRYIEEHCLEDRWSALKIMNSRRFAYLGSIGYLYRYRGAQAHPAISSDAARRDFHDTERRLHAEARGLLYFLLWIRRLPFRTNRGKWPCRNVN